MLLIRKISVEEESGEKLETEKCNSLHWQISSDQMKGFKDEDNYKNYNNYNINYNNYCLPWSVKTLKSRSVKTIKSHWFADLFWSVLVLVCRFILTSLAGLQIYSDQFGWFADLFWSVLVLVCRFILTSLALAMDDWRWPLMIGVGHGWLAVICRFCFAQMEFYINPRRALFVAWSCVPLCDGVRWSEMH